MVAHKTSYDFLPKEPKQQCLHMWRKLTAEDTVSLKLLSNGYQCVNCDVVKNFIGKQEDNMSSLTLDLDKLDQELMNELKERTGKTEVEIIKLALYELNLKYVKTEVKITPQPPVFIPIPQVVPSKPVNPFEPNDTNPWPYFPQPYIWYGSEVPGGMKWMSWSTNDIVCNDGHWTSCKK
jgi:hypothetical protein